MITSSSQVNHHPREFENKQGLLHSLPPFRSEILTFILNFNTAVENWHHIENAVWNCRLRVDKVLQIFRERLKEGEITPKIWKDTREGLRGGEKKTKKKTKQPFSYTRENRNQKQNLCWKKAKKKMVLLNWTKTNSLMQSTFPYKDRYKLRRLFYNYSK